ncbi:hypothetical protein TI39_contig4156g00005 [Zymoseptoria brevis]|uniref:MYND-type domain-containing protein n=1 Tax=Zymoseptoria brevis TaxID=1047168 RepID=A0A0F4GBV9_9PEZI|nr:hypothetical protein TI39_contig4156g00005 [Zymoseptoria brevis]
MAEVQCLVPQPANLFPPLGASPEMQQKFTGSILVIKALREKLALREHRQSTIAVQLGVPLKLISFSSDAYSFTNAFTNQLVGFELVERVLLIESDPASPHFGEFPASLNGEPFLVTHSDGHDLESDAILPVIFDYINDHFIAYKKRVATLEEGVDKELAEKQITQKLSKEAFHAHFEECRRLAIAKKKPFWANPRSPVLLKHPNVSPACGTCGALASSAPVSSPVKLSKCAKCKFRHYCSRECQKEDWATHKHACKIKIPA